MTEVHAKYACIFNNSNNACLTAFIPDNIGKPTPERYKLFWILVKQEMIGWQWHQLDHMQIICISLLTHLVTQFV